MKQVLKASGVSANQAKPMPSQAGFGFDEYHTPDFVAKFSSLTRASVGSVIEIIEVQHPKTEPGSLILSPSKPLSKHGSMKATGPMGVPSNRGKDLRVMTASKACFHLRLRLHLHLTANIRHARILIRLSGRRVKEGCFVVFFTYSRVLQLTGQADMTVQDSLHVGTT